MSIRISLSKPMLQVLSAFLVNISAGFFLLAVVSLQDLFVLTFNSLLCIVYVLLSVQIEHKLQHEP